MNAMMMNVHMVNEIEGYLQLGRQNADNLCLTELLSSSLSSSPVVARLCPGCKAYVQRVSDWQPFAPVPCLHDVAAQILSEPVVSRIATDVRCTLSINNGLPLPFLPFRSACPCLKYACL